MEYLEVVKRLKRMGIKTPPFTVFDGDVYKLKKWARDKFPVVVKAVSVLHKTEKGAVILDNYDENSLVSAVYRLANAFPFSQIVVEKQIKRGVEVFFGVKKDKIFNYIAFLGLGGVYVELFNDISSRPLPLNREDIYCMLNETKLGIALKGFRGKTYDVECLVNTIIKLSKFAKLYVKDSMDVNPIIVLERGCYVVDVKVR